MENTLPKDLAGYQHMQCGVIQAGDIRVFDGRPIAYAGPSYYGASLTAFELETGERIYRKMPTANCRDDKALWGERLNPLAEAIGEAFDMKRHRIPQDDKTRKEMPLYRGLLGYFPAALAEVAHHSYLSDKKHNPDATDGPTWARAKSSDHPDCIIRHLIDSGLRVGGPVPSDDQIYHLTAVAWRALALLQEALESRGAAPGVSSRS